MPRTRSGLTYPKKGSAEAKAWGAKMRALRGKTRRTKNPGAKWHLEHAHLERDMADRTPRRRERYLHEGAQRAHLRSAVVAKRMGMNPRRKKRLRPRSRARTKRNPIVIYNRPKRALRRNQPKGTLLYNSVLEVRARKDYHPQYKGQRFFHRFKNPYPKVYGLPNGDLLITSGGKKRLWIPEDSL